MNVALTGFWEDWRFRFLKCEESEDKIFGKVKKWRLKNEDQLKVWRLSVKIVFLSVKILKLIMAGSTHMNGISFVHV